MHSIPDREIDSVCCGCLSGRVLCVSLNDVCYCRRTLVSGECPSKEPFETTHSALTSSGSETWSGSVSMSSSLGLLLFLFGFSMCLITQHLIISNIVLAVLNLYYIIYFDLIRQVHYPILTKVEQQRSL